MASSSGHEVAAVTLRKFSTSGDPRRNCEKFIQVFNDWCELSGWYDNKPSPPPIEEGGEIPPAGPVWLAKRKAMAAFRFAIAGNEEHENNVQAFQISEKEQREPEIILKHLKDYSMANEGVLTERTKFAQMTQEHHKSVTALQART